MKIGKLLILLLAGTGILSVHAQAAKTDKIPCNVGYSVRNMVDVDPRDAEASLRVWAGEWGDQHGFQVVTVFYESAEKLVADFVAKKIDFVGMDSVDFLRMEKTMKARAEMTLSRNGKSSVRYLVLTGDAQKKSLADFKNKKLSILKNNHLGKMFLDTHLMRADYSPSERFFSSIQERSKESQAILDVFFGQSDVCVVPDVVFSTMKEMNPQVGRKLRVIAESPDLVASLGIFRPDWPGEYKRKAMKALSGEFKTERGKQILLLFNFEKVDVMNEEQLESIRKLLVEYERLKKKKNRL